jgi:ribosome-associated translation inhibitor RaiA
MSGVVYNEKGKNSNTTPQQRYMRKLQSALDMAIDGLGKQLGMDGASAVAVRITEALDKDCVGTLAKLTPFIPKNINVDVQVNKEAHQLSDADLEAIIAARKEDKIGRTKVIEGEIIEDKGE